MLINISNNHSSSWQTNQLEMAINKYESIVDFDFPSIDPTFSEDEINEIAEDYYIKIIPYFSNADRFNAVHIMAEPTFTFCLVSKLLKKGIEVIASTTKGEIKNIKEEVEIEFVKFRKYTNF